MAFEHKELCGSLFNNDRKQADNQPDMTGDVMINGRLMRIAGWWKQSSRGDFLSVKISEKQERQQGSSNQGQQRPQQPAQRPAYRSPARPTAAQRVLGNEYQGEPELPSSAGTSTPENEIPFAPNRI